MSWTVYIIQAESGRLYTGITKDLERRFKEHKEKPQGARFFRFSSPEKVVYQESQPNRSEATKREREIKRMTRKQKMLLVVQNKSFVV